jgi:arsenate reductase (thioredoxin)
VDPVVVTKENLEPAVTSMQKTGGKKPILYSAIVGNIERCINDFDKIPEERKKTLRDLTGFIEKKLAAGKKALLVFICTHNSRRSHMAQLWAQAAAAYYEIPDVLAYSGGTEVTAFNNRAVKTMEEMVFRIKPTTGDENPFYEIRFSEDHPSIKGFSNKYDAMENPKRDFGAIMTCSHADENCPFVPGAEMRMTISFDDPKDFDGTSKEAAMYAFSNVKLSKT